MEIRYEDEHNKKDQKKFSRRALLPLLGIGGLSLSGLVALVTNLLYLKPSVDYGPPKVFRAGNPHDYKVGTRIPFNDVQTVVVRDEAGFAAISLVCTHLGCTCRTSDAGFECPCHGSQYDEQGRVTGGPAPRPLDWYQVSLAPTGEIEVDKSKKIDPETYFTV